MIEHVQIENFRCLRAVDVPLKPLTVLIGPNDSGKSAFLVALQRLVGNKIGNLDDHWRMDPKVLPNIVACFRGRDGPYVKLTYGRGSSASPGARLVDLQPVEYYRLPSEGPRLLGPAYRDTGDPPEIDPSGEQVAALLDHILRRDRSRFDSFAQALKDHIPGLDDVNVGSPEVDRRRVELKVENGLLVNPENMSTGVRMIVFFLALAYHPKPPRLMLIEEPENGVHPKRLEDVMSLLRSITRGEHCGHAAQIVLTTHSPLLLDYVNMDTDQVLVFKRNDDGSRTAEPVDADRLKTFLGHFMLGEVWLNEQEEGLVGQKQ